MIEIEKIVEYIQTCPFMEDIANIFTDFVGSNADDFGLFDEGEGQPIQRDLLGNELIPHKYSLVARKATASNLQRLASTNFSQKFTDWIRAKNAFDTFPEVPEGFQAWSIQAMNGRITRRSQDTKTSVYEIPIIFQYWRFVENA